MVKNGLKKQEEWHLIDLARNKSDEQAFAEIFARYKGYVFHLVLQMIRDHDIAEDLLIEIFTKAFSKLHTFQPRSSFSSWLATIAKNHTLDYLRKKRPKKVSLDAALDTDDDAPFLELKDENPIAIDQMIIKERNNKLRRIVETLKPKYRTLIELRYYQELSYDEIAQKLNIPLGTVKAQLFRARDLLSQIVKSNTELK
ncbi:sigma-70 family RNA polymerase sigma factor [Luteibaculum oceani]|uniref:Sigma-70 family RNA polymerase sigma factor n=1 Tax=Luteibaculum oceani TaxID=1294296 RepID=A0A5C6V9Y4_9FLAO|nr:sigma-70 family RNA polymerase sigma factor [Luteibaculum oceani]